MARNKTSTMKPGSAVARGVVRNPHGAGIGSTAGNRRFTMIQEAAYFRALRAGFKGDPGEHWLAAEQEIDRTLRRD